MRGIPGQALIGQLSIADPRNDKRRVGGRSAKYVPGKREHSPSLRIVCHTSVNVTSPGTCSVL